MRSVHVADEAALYALGVLDPRDVARVERHASRCARCARDLGVAERGVAALTRLDGRHVPPERLARRIAISAAMSSSGGCAPTS